MNGSLMSKREQRAGLIPGAQLRPQSSHVNHQLRQRNKELCVVAGRQEHRVIGSTGTGAGRQRQRAGAAQPQWEQRQTRQLAHLPVGIAAEKRVTTLASPIAQAQG